MMIERRINKHSSKAISYSNIYLKKISRDRIWRRLCTTGFSSNILFMLII